MCQPVAIDKCPYCEYPAMELERWVWHGYALPDALRGQECKLCQNERLTGSREGDKGDGRVAAGKSRSKQLRWGAVT